jgi:hypothetical protein
MEEYPAAFIEPAAERLSDLLQAELKRPVDISKISPQVAAVSPLIQAAQQRTATQAGLGALQFDPRTGEVTSVGRGTGIAAYEPSLQRAQADIAGARGMVSPTAYQQFMSPYQQEVIKTTQDLLAEQRAAGRPQLAATAIGAGAYGGGRAGVAQAEYERQRDIFDAAQLAQLRQAGYESAVNQAQLAGQALRGIGAQQAGLGTTQQALEAGVQKQLGATGAGAQTYSQSLLEAVRQGNVLGAEYPLARLSTATNILSPLIAGAAAAPTPTAPLLTNPALTGLQGFAGTYGLLSGPTQQAQRSGLGSLYPGF